MLMNNQFSFSAKWPKKIAVLAHIGNGNLGDEATFSVVLKYLKKYCPAADVLGLVVNPGDTQDRHQVKALPLRRGYVNKLQGKDAKSAQMHPENPKAKEAFRVYPVVRWLLFVCKRILRSAEACLCEALFLFQSARRLRGTDLLLVAGGGQLGDYFGGPGGYPFTIFKWTMLSRILGSKVAFLSIGAGPINHRLSRWLFRRSLRCSSYSSFRDPGSKKLMEKIGGFNGSTVTPDMVYALRTEPWNHPVKTRSRPRVGINPLPFFDARYWAERQDSLYQNYMNNLCDLVVWLIETGHDVDLFPTQLRADPPVIAELELLAQKRLDNRLHDRLRMVHIENLDELLTTIADMDTVIATRYHGVIISSILAKPIIGIAYQSKTRELMEALGLHDYLCDISEINSSILIEKVKQLESDTAGVSNEIKKKLTCFRETVENQFESIFGGNPGRTQPIPNQLDKDRQEACGYRAY
jgi:polysaccharide pyruvyl transferase WcaK-like protein